MLWIATITECRVARGYVISSGGEHICNIGHICDKTLLTDQHIYYLKPVGNRYFHVAIL